MKNTISVSTAPIAKLNNSRYYDLLGTIKIMKKVLEQSVVDGFEFQIQPEWDNENPPLSDIQFADWTKTPKFTFAEILELLEKEELPILSVHASRDIGCYLCSNRKQYREKGKRLIHDSLSLATDLKARVCVFHLWDTQETGFDIYKITGDFQDIAAQFPRVKTSVENIPTHLVGHTPFSLVKLFDYVTLDTKWAALYDQLDQFESILERIVNVHLRGSLKDDKWFFNSTSFGFYEALHLIRDRWKYPGLLTMEPEGERNRSLFNVFLNAMRSLRDQSS